jgi:hypothetical protein
MLSWRFAGGDPVASECDIGKDQQATTGTTFMVWRQTVK